MVIREGRRDLVDATAAMLPTTKHRRGRRTPRQEAALRRPTPYLLPTSLEAMAQFLREGAPPILDIGFGTGEAVVAYAQSDLETRILAVDMHTPGIGDLLATIDEQGLANVFVVDADVRAVLTDWLPASSLAGARTFFPDPWPKKRHHRRRLIQPAFSALLADRVIDGGFWHIATDWPDYAEHIEAVVAGDPAWVGGRVGRPASRPATKFERRGLAAGRPPVDLVYERVPR